MPSRKPSEGPALPLATVADQYLADLRTRARPASLSGVSSILARVILELGVATVGEIDRPGVSAWRQARVAAGAANKTVNNALGVLHAALALAVRMGQLEVDPIAGLQSLPSGPRHQRRRPRALSEWEIARLMAASDELDREAADYHAARRTIAGHTKGDLYAARDRAGRIPQAVLVRALIETGARWGELTQATWSDFDEPAALLTLRAETTKTDTERSVPIRPDTCEALRAYRLTCAAATGCLPGAHEAIFRTSQGKPCARSTSNFRRFLGRAYERAGLLVRDGRGHLRSQDGRALNVHTLRHTCCTRLLKAGVPVPVVQAIGGWSTPTMPLRIYSHFRAEDARAFVNSLIGLPGRGSTGPVAPEVSPRALGVGTDPPL